MHNKTPGVKKSTVLFSNSISSSFMLYADGTLNGFCKYLHIFQMNFNIIIIHYRVYYHFPIVYSFHLSYEHCVLYDVDYLYLIIPGF